MNGVIKLVLASILALIVVAGCDKDSWVTKEINIGSEHSVQHDLVNDVDGLVLDGELGSYAAFSDLPGTPTLGSPGMFEGDFPSDLFEPGTPNLGFGEDDFAPIVGLPAPYPVCGNGIVEPTEQCDDANDDNMDGCNVLCRFPICGNGVLEEFEQCDDNNNASVDGCTKDCLYEICGNKITETQNGEQCDDGNHKGGDGCSPCCKFEVCGNGIVDPNEQCDDGNIVDSDGCSCNCLLETKKATVTNT